MTPAIQQRKVRSRFTAKVTAGIRLEERDQQLLRDLFLNRLISRGQIEALYFNSTIRCNVRLRQLFDHGFVTRYFPPVSPYGAQVIYMLGKNAVPLVAAALEMDLSEVRRLARQSRTATFIDHALKVVDLWIAFRQAAEREQSLKIEAWLPEILCRHEYIIRSKSTGESRREVFKPDALVRLRDASGTLSSFFIEADLGHTSTRQFLTKLLIHQRYRESRLFEEIYGTLDFRTLVVTTSERRITNLRSLVEGQNSDLFWFTTFEKVKVSGVLSAIWQVPFADSLSDLASTCK